jgi:topoisomerase IA-like protein
MIEMAKVTKTAVDKALRDKVFEMLFDGEETSGSFVKINDRQYGILLVDANGEQRYVRIGAIVAELREDMTAQELMASEIDTYQQKQADKAEKAKTKAEKIAKDKAKREAEKAKREAEAKAKEEGISES